MEHIAKAQNIEDDNFREIHHDYNKNIEATVFQVKSLLSSEGYHELYLPRWQVYISKNVLV